MNRDSEHPIEAQVRGAQADERPLVSADKAGAWRWLMVSMFAMVALGWLTGFTTNLIAAALGLGLWAAGPVWLQAANKRLLGFNLMILATGVLPVFMALHSVVVLPQTAMGGISLLGLLLKALLLGVSVLAMIALKIAVLFQGVRFYDRTS